MLVMTPCCYDSRCRSDGTSMEILLASMIAYVAATSCRDGVLISFRYWLRNTKPACHVFDSEEEMPFDKT